MMKIVALGGLLQGPALFPKKWHGIELCRYRGTLDQAADQLCKDIPPGDNFLVGYSLGGRLGLHALIRHPHLWRGAALLSVNPGIKPSEREERCRQDALWAHRFLTEDFDQVLNDWNRQEVFQGHLLTNPAPSKEEIARRLREWSLGLQEDLREAIHQLKMPILWAVGMRDKKFLSIANSMTFSNPHSQIWKCPECGHRLLEERGDFVVSFVENFFKNKI